MKNVLLLSRLEQIKALADPLRMRILELFCAEPMTTKQLAVKLEEKPTKLYHHVNALEEAGMVDVVETKQNRGTVEKYYRAVARKFAVDHKLISANTEPTDATGQLQTVVIEALQTGLREACESFGAGEAGEVPTIAGYSRVRLSNRQATELGERLQEWLRDFQEADEKGGAVEYNLTLGFFPLNKGAK